MEDNQNPFEGLTPVDALPTGVNEDPFAGLTKAETQQTDAFAGLTKTDSSPKYQELKKEISDILNNMSNMKIKTKSIISESLKPMVAEEKHESNLLDESNLLEEM